MPCNLGWSQANIYGSSVGWLENTKISIQPICYLNWKLIKIGLYARAHPQNVSVIGFTLPSRRILIKW